MNTGQSTRIKFSVLYEIEIDVKSAEELNIDLTEIIAHYLPKQNLPGSAQAFVNAKPLPNFLSLEANEEAAIERALEEAKGNVAIAAQILGITRATVYAKMKKYDITAMSDKKNES